MSSFADISATATSSMQASTDGAAAATPSADVNRIFAVSILKRETEEKKKKKKGKGKPSPAEIEHLRKIKSDRKTFLASLSDEKREALLPSTSITKQKNDANNVTAAREAKLREQNIQQLQALRSFAVPAHELVDIGANLQERNSRPGITRLLERSAASGTTRVVLTGCSIKGSRKGLETCRWWAQNASNSPSTNIQSGAASSAPVQKTSSDRVRLYGTAGIHPHDAKTICSATTQDGGGVYVREDCLETLRTLAADPFCVALGECGLDYDRMLSSREMQMAAFEAQVALAASLAKPLFVHLRELDSDRGPPIGAYTDAAEILSKYPSIPPDNVCIHCFTGDSTDLSQLMQRGYMLGLTGFAGMKKRATANGTLAALGMDGGVPLAKLMIETDAPYMMPDKEWLPKPVGIKGKNEPAALPGVCRAVAAALGKEVSDVARESSANAVRFFALDDADVRIAALSLSVVEIGGP